MMRGLTRKDTAFFEWTQTVLNGGNYRTDMIIYQAHIDNLIPSKIFDLAKSRKIILHECFPTRYKPGSDLDASASEVSIVELEVEVEYFEEA